MSTVSSEFNKVSAMLMGSSGTGFSLGVTGK